MPCFPCSYPFVFQVHKLLILFTEFLRDSSKVKNRLTVEQHVSRLPICRGSSSKRLVDILHHGISGHAEELKGAKALIDGKLVINSKLVV